MREHRVVRHHGVLLGVELSRYGSFAVGAHSAGAETLHVHDMADFWEDGGQVTLGADTVTYSEAVSDDDAGDYLTVPGGIPADLADRSAVYVYPAAQRKTALVQLLDLDADSDAVRADVPSGHLWADKRLMEGAQPGALVTVEATRGRNSVWTVVDLPKQAPQIAPEFLAPGVVNVAVKFATAASIQAADGTALLTGAGGGAIPTQISSLQTQVDGIERSGGRHIDGGTV